MAHFAGKRARPRCHSGRSARDPMGSAMPLTLITGPANAAKAGAVLERLRAALPRDPVLVVPTSADATHYARELAGAGLVFGADVTTFPRLMRDIARDGRRARAAARPARPRARSCAPRSATSSCARSRPRPRAPASPTRSGTCSRSCSARWPRPARFGAAVRAWREAGTAPPHAGELAALYSAYHRAARGARGGRRRRPDARSR